jgi:uncharacterized protein
MFVHTQAPPGFNPNSLKPPLLGNGPWQISAIALDISGRCNLACRYCAESATQPRRHAMQEETLFAAWRFLLPDGILRHRSSIRLGSGEPLLGLPILRRLADLVAQSQSTQSEYQLDVFLTTNGTLIDDEILKWLVTTGWQVKVSLDGPETIQDRWRVTQKGKGTYSIVAPVVANMAQRIPERLSVTAVLCRNADPGMIFTHLQNLGVRKVEFVPVVHQDPDVLPSENDLEQYEHFLTVYAHKLLEAGSTQSLPILVRFENIIRRVMGYDLKRVPCGAGRSFLGIGPDGDFYPCFRFIGVDNFRIGNLITGVSQDFSRAFQTGPGRSYEQRYACCDCWAAPLCGGPCFACAEMFGPGNGEPNPLHCAYFLADAWWAVWLVDQFRQRFPDRLLTFLPDYARAYIED